MANLQATVILKYAVANGPHFLSYNVISINILIFYIKRHIATTQIHVL